MRHLILILLAFSLSACEKNILPEGYCQNSEQASEQDWLNKKIRSYKRNGTSAEIFTAKLGTQPVIIINTCPGCADTMDAIYNCEGEQICTVGGISGANTCSDYGEFSDIELIWSN